MASPPRSARSAPRSEEALKAEERAEVVVTKLERFIRDHRTLTRGVSFRKWQDMAKSEIAQLIVEVQNDHHEQNRSAERLLILLGVSLATIGVWGMALALQMAPNRFLAALLVAVAGVVALWVAGAFGLRSPLRRFRVNSTRKSLERVRSLNSKVTELEQYLKKRKRALEGEIEALPED